MKTKNGFTLIELLMVIALAALLLALVLVAVAQVRNKANDSRIVSNMDQLRKLAATIYAENNMTTYCDATCSGLACDTKCFSNVNNSIVQDLIADINNRNGGTYGLPSLYTSNGSYCILATTSRNKKICYDSTGKSGGTFFSSVGSVCAGSSAAGYYCN